MGDFKQYNESGGFDQYLYCQVGDTVTADNGVRGKVIDKITDESQVFHDSLPMYSNTSEVYFKMSDKGSHPIEQARVYKSRKVALDFDWNHKHGDFEIGVVHVHEWYEDENGHWTRSDHPRYMNEEEIAQYENLFKKAAPWIKLRP